MPLKLTTDQNQEWFTWSRKFPHEGNAIPIVYVVRADGAKLYAKSGPLAGDALPQLLLATMQQSGRAFSDAETALLESSVKDAKSALADADNAAAAMAIGKLARLGTLGELKSYAELSLEADALTKKLIEDAKKDIAGASAKLQDPETAFDGMLTLVAAETAYTAFADLRVLVGSQLREARKTAELKELAAQAESLQRARQYAKSDLDAVRRKAEGAYDVVIKKYAGSRAASLARAELAEINPDANTPTLRTWTDNTGNFTIDAKYVQQKQGFVQLEKSDGSLVALPISSLSPADQAYVKER